MPIDVAFNVQSLMHSHHFFKFSGEPQSRANKMMSLFPAFATPLARDSPLVFPRACLLSYTQIPL